MVFEAWDDAKRDQNKNIRNNNYAPWCPHCGHFNDVLKENLLLDGEHSMICDNCDTHFSFKTTVENIYFTTFV